MEKSKAQRIMEEIANADAIIFSAHCLERMGERGVRRQEVSWLLVNGAVIESDQINQDEVAVIIEGRDLDGNILTMVARIQITSRQVLCVTVY
jgi:hypothetical protein